MHPINGRFVSPVMLITVRYFFSSVCLKNNAIHRFTLFLDRNDEKKLRYLLS